MADEKGWVRVLAWVPPSAALIVAAVVGAGALTEWKSYAPHTVDVTGSAKKRIVSDLAEWEARVTSTDADLVTSFKNLGAQVDKTVAFLKSKGVKDEEIHTSAVNRSEVYETTYEGTGEDRIQRRVRTGYTTGQSVIVRSTDVSLVERLAREVTGLIDQGVSVDSYAPSYYYTKLADVKIEQLAEASRDARTRAERTVEAAAGGARELSLRELNMGVINVNPANSTATSWDGNNDTTSLEKDIITIIHCTFDLK
ncbi:MAG: SIMPL domain-containing protein [Myxococcales bacterium]|nr:SIMPL domain-containing protein [Myxococcales bacterium]MCB9731741.1 SIMPL domain-containing protein [Deltaproteobacteria bacterium]